MILVTGGAGYIGSHTCVELVSAGYDLIVLDNLSNASVDSLRKVEMITKSEIKFVHGDIRDYSLVNKLFNDHQIDSVIHFAGLKAVGESVAQPISYYDNNVYGCLQLLRVMREHNVKNIVFSSSATVYGDPVVLPLNEAMATSNPTNPYGMSKLMIENILHDIVRSDNEWNVVILRYFNPVGAHKSGFIGEDPSGTPSNLMPYITQTAIGQQEKLYIFGDDYDTSDGTGVRDYIHVVDLAVGHIKALANIHGLSGVLTVNLGTGVGYSVLELVNEFERVTGNAIPYEIVDRRPGDVASCYADATYAKKILGWESMYGLAEMCEDSWRWQLNNPHGYN